MTLAKIPKTYEINAGVATVLLSRGMDENGFKIVYKNENTEVRFYIHNDVDPGYLQGPYETVSEALHAMLNSPTIQTVIDSYFSKIYV
jgi:hypothetical protein